MGKKYYCEYCDKSMAATPMIVKTHNKGVVHQKLVGEHYQQYKDPETIMKEETLKKPCVRFARGECSFGNICRFSHYTSSELDTIRELVESKQKQTELTAPSLELLYQKLQVEKSNKPVDSKDGNTVFYDCNGVTHVLPWTYNSELDNYNDLPPSIQHMKTEDFLNSKFVEWG